MSREAPVFILCHEQTETTPGGAGNCAANLAALGAKVKLISVIGNDETGQVLDRKLREAGVDCSGLLQSAGRRTTTKVRVLAGQIHSTRQQVIRIDYDNESGLSVELHQALGVEIRKAVGDAGAVIISDYNYGVANPSIASLMREVAEQTVPVLAEL